MAATHAWEAKSCDPAASRTQCDHLSAFGHRPVTVQIVGGGTVPLRSQPTSHRREDPPVDPPHARSPHRPAHPPWCRRPARRLLLVPVSIAVTLCSLGAGGPSSRRAAADPSPSARDVRESREVVRQRAEEVGRIKARLVAADTELDRLGALAAAAVERYHGEQVKLARAQNAYRLAVQRLAAARASYEVTRAEVAALAAQAYRARTGGNAFVIAIAGDGGPQGFLDRSGLLQLIGRRQADATHRLKAAETVENVFRRQADAELRAQSEATERARQAESDIRSAVARQQDAVR